MASELVPMSPGAHVVVVGGGQAAAQFAEALRFEGHRGPVTLVSEELSLPYQRPPLSKGFLAGQHAVDWLAYRPPDSYADNDVETLLGRTVASIDRSARAVLLKDGTRLGYDRLAIATGARVRRIAVPGSTHDVVRYLRTVEDAQAIRERLTAARRVVVIGGGFIGLEVAATLAGLGRSVTLLESAPRLLPRASGEILAGFLGAVHARAGVRILTGVRIAELRGSDTGVDVLCEDGAIHPAELVVAGVGITPVTELAAACGLACDDGILVDERAMSSDPHIVAFGDCARAPNAFLGGMARLETVHNAVEQAKTAAATLVGRDAPYRQVPWVWSDQYSYRIQMVGDCSAPEIVLRGDVAAGRATLFHYAGAALRGACAINRPAEFGVARRLLQQAVPVSRAVAADAGFDLERLLPARRRPGFEREWPRELARVAARGRSGP